MSNRDWDKEAWTGVAGIAFIDGRKAERSRIIGLLLDKRCVCLDLTGERLRSLIDSDTPMKHANCDYVGLDWVIALIKGENK